MARPQRNDVDYFPFYCKQGGSTDYIETTYGNDGFAVWVKILRELATTNYHYLNLSVRQKAMTFSSKCKVSEDMMYKIICDLVELGEFDRELWEENRILWSDKFIDSIEDAYKKRNNKIVKREEFIQLLVSLGIRKHISIGVNSPVNPQRREEKSKEEESRENGACVFDDEKLVPREATDLIDAICDYFEVKKITTSKIYNSIDDFVRTVTHRNELTIVSASLTKYIAYKARSKEAKHNVLNWIGTKDEHYKDGQWSEIDWELKLKNYERESTKGTNGSTGTKVTTNGNDYAAGLRQR